MEEIQRRRRPLIFFDLNGSFFLWIILVISTYIKFFYVFHDTHYANYLVSEMGTYWNTAVQSFYRGDFDVSQWNTRSPFAHMVLAWMFKIIYLLGLYTYKLKIILGINIFLSTLSVWFVYLIARYLYPSGAFALLAAFVYAFFFPLIYFNAFILSCNPSVFLLMLSIVMVLYRHDDRYLYLFVIGLTLASAVAIEPKLLLTAVPLFLYILFRNKFSRHNIARAAMFALGYFLLLFLVAAENNTISVGKVKGLSARNGFDYYMASCRKHLVRSQTEEGAYFTEAAQEASRPKPANETFSVSDHNQEFFYKKATECLKQHPFTLQERFSKFRLLYFDTMFPVMLDAKYAKEWLPIFSRIVLWMTSILLLLPFLFMDRRIPKSALFLLVGTVLSQLIFLYFFNIEQRDLYGFFFVITLLSLLTLFSLIQNIKRIWLRLLPYITILGGVLLVLYQ